MNKLDKLEKNFCYEVAKEIGDYDDFIENDVDYESIEKEFEYWIHRIISQNVSKKGYDFLSYLLDKRGFDLDEEMNNFFYWVDKEDYDGYVKNNFPKFKNKIEVLDFYGVCKNN